MLSFFIGFIIGIVVIIALAALVIFKYWRPW